jgi:hypothetical protein
MGEAQVGSKSICRQIPSLIGPFHTLLSAAILAPSGDNTQPWRFEIDERESTITLRVDESRDTSPMNAGQRMARIACGAALENIIRTAELNGWNPEIVRFLSSGHGVTVRVAAERSDEAGKIEACISQRATRRVRYDGRPICPAIVERLQSCAPDDPDAKMLWITDRNETHAIAAQIGQCDALMFGEPAFLHAFLDNLRSDLPSDAVAEHGLGLGTLGLSTIENVSLPLMRKLPDLLVRSRFFRAAFARKARTLVSSSSGVWVLLTRQTSTENDFSLGRLMQRAWLQLTREGLVAQPMMSLPVLLGSIQFERAMSLETSRTVKSIHNRFRELIRTDNQFAVAALIRFGHAEQSPIRTGRRSIDCVTTIVS